MPSSQKWYGWIPDKGDYRDLRATHLEAVQQVPPLDYVSFKILPWILDQGEQGSCTGHACRSLGTVVRALGGQSFIDLSPRFLYWGARRLRGTTADDSGAEIRDVIKAAANWGFASTLTCPYNQRIWWRSPSMFAYMVAKSDMAIEYRRINRNLKALQASIPKGGFIFGYSVYENFESDEMTKTGIMEMPKGTQTGGHAVYAVGYDDARKAFLIANSWGDDWGCVHPHGPQNKRGYFWMPYEYILHPDLADDFWIISKIT